MEALVDISVFFTDNQRTRGRAGATNSRLDEPRHACFGSYVAFLDYDDT